MGWGGHFPSRLCPLGRRPADLSWGRGDVGLCPWSWLECRGDGGGLLADEPGGGVSLRSAPSVQCCRGTRSRLLVPGLTCANPCLPCPPEARSPVFFPASSPRAPGPRGAVGVRADGGAAVEGPVLLQPEPWGRAPCRQVQGPLLRGRSAGRGPAGGLVRAGSAGAGGRRRGLRAGPAANPPQQLSFPPTSE